MSIHEDNQNPTDGSDVFTTVTMVVTAVCVNS